MTNFTSYTNYDKSKDIHGVAIYPAPMIAPVTQEIIGLLFKNRHIESLFDPFCGSGTILYETSKFSPDTMVVGCDINPYAILMTEVKMLGVTKSIENDLRTIETIIMTDEYANHYFPNIEKWYTQGVISDLSKLKSAIEKIDCEQNRKYFWLILSEIAAGTVIQDHLHTNYIK